ncbi:MAG: DUF2878 domain-containing protein [Gammaproteobacteria bacterium]|nr:DUF2878 domain-containing protein [Gammaproteobacteria bacterium]
MLHIIINAVLFQLTWFALVMGNIQLGLACVIVMLCHVLWRVNHKSQLWVFLLFVVSAGVITDTLMGMMSVYEFEQGRRTSPIIPTWLILLWLGFALTLNHALAWLVTNLKYSLPLFAVMGPLSYWLGAQLNPQALSVSLQYLPLLILQWAFMAVLIFWLTQQLTLNVADSRESYELH